MAIDQGALYWYDFGPRKNHLQEGRRPVLVIQANSLNRLDGYPNVIIVPLTTRERPAATYVRIEATQETRLERTSWAICNQVFTIDKGELREEIGTVSKSAVYAVKQGLKVAFGILRDE